MPSVAFLKADDAGIHAQVSLKDLSDVSDYDYVAVCEPGSGDDSYITYSYNADKVPFILFLWAEFIYGCIFLARSA